MRAAASIFGVIALATPCLAQAADRPAMPPANAAPMPAAPSLSLQSALLLAQTTIEECRAKGAEVSVGIVNAAGVAKLIMVADGGGGKPDTAQRKAAAAAAFKQSGLVMEAREKTDSAFAAQIEANKDKYNDHGGSQPLYVKGELRGGVGVTGIEPHDVAQACVDAALAKVEKKLQ